MHDEPRYSSFVDVVEVGGVHDRAVDHHVVVDELRRTGAVGHDPADRAGDQEHVLGSVGLEPVRHLGLVAQIELLPLGGENVGVAISFETANDRRPDEARMPGNIDPRIELHFDNLLVSSGSRAHDGALAALVTCTPHA